MISYKVTTIDLFYISFCSCYSWFTTIYVHNNISN